MRLDHEQYCGRCLMEYEAGQVLRHCDRLAALPVEVAAEVGVLLDPAETPLPQRPRAKVPDSLTYAHTARRAFEVAYWKTITALAEGTYLNKNNADCVRDADPSLGITNQTAKGRSAVWTEARSCAYSSARGGRAIADWRP